MSVAGGLGIGMAVGAFRELMNGSFFTREQVESAVQTACISVVPLVKSDSPTLSSKLQAYAAVRSRFGRQFE